VPKGVRECFNFGKHWYKKGYQPVANLKDLLADSHKNIFHQLRNTRGAINVRQPEKSTQLSL
jgi:hypothetical protein